MNRVKQLVHAENVYRMGYTGKNIRVVTLDTGVYLHPDLRQNVVGFLDFVAMKRACYDDMDTEHMLAEFCVRMAE